MIVYKALANIEAISFDLDDTLYNNSPYIEAAESALISYIEEQYPIAAHLTSHDWIILKRAALQDYPELGNDISQLRMKTLQNGFHLARMEPNLIPSAVSDCFNMFHKARSNFMVSNEVLNVLKALAQVVPLAAITNGNVDCKAIGIDRYFTSIIHASPKTPMKPHSSMFNFTSEALNIPATNILHVGDDLEKDIQGAIQAGFQSAWFAMNRPMQLNRETKAPLLPHVQLNKLSELTILV